MIKNSTQYDFQYDFRVDSQLKIIKLLQSGEKSINYLKDNLGISFTAVSKVVNQLLEYKILEKAYEKPSKGKLGRNPVLFKLNTSNELTCSVDFSSMDITITLNDLSGNIVSTRTIPNTLYITLEVLNQTSLFIKEMLASKEAKKRKLMNIVVACPGLINKNNGEVVNSFRYQYKNNPSPSAFFFKEFGAPTYVYNDVKIACIGEKAYGVIPKAALNYCLIHIGNAVGAALVFDGKLYQGQFGFSGEFTNDEKLKESTGVERNRLRGLWYIAEIVEEKNPKSSIIKDKFRIDFDKAEKLFKENNEAFDEGLKALAKQNAQQIIAYNDFLDLEYIIIEGSIVKFEEKYKEYLLENIKKYSNNFRAKLIFSSLEDKASLKGTIFQANRLYFLSKLENIANEQNVNGSYNIFDSFGDNI